MAGKDDGVKDYLSGFKVASIEKKVLVPSSSAGENDQADGANLVGGGVDSDDEGVDENNQVFQNLLREERERLAKIE
jgi:hypothetical protein